MNITPAVFRVHQVAQYLSVHKNTIWRYAKEDATFPRPIKLSEQTTVWHTAEIDEWLRMKQEGGQK